MQDDICKLQGCIYECGAACACSGTTTNTPARDKGHMGHAQSCCAARVTQRGCSVRVRVAPAPGKVRHVCGQAKARHYLLPCCVCACAMPRLRTTIPYVCRYVCQHTFGSGLNITNRNIPYYYCPELHHAPHMPSLFYYTGLGCVCWRAHPCTLVCGMLRGGVPQQRPGSGTPGRIRRRGPRACAAGGARGTVCEM